MKDGAFYSISLALILSSCAQISETPSVPKSHELVGTRWWPVELHGECVLNRIFENFPVLSFNQDSLGIEMDVRGGGNFAGRSVTFQGDSILADRRRWPIPSGLCRCVRTKECIDQQMERLLYEAGAYRIIDDTLFIFGKQADERIGTFVRYGINDYIPSGCGD